MSGVELPSCFADATRAALARARAYRTGEAVASRRRLADKVRRLDRGRK